MANPQLNENGIEWIEAGVTNGFIKDIGCTLTLSTYYGFNLVLTGIDGDPMYQELRVAGGRVNAGHDIDVRIERSSVDRGNVDVYVTTPQYSISGPTVSLGMDDKNLYHANFGIEGTVSAVDEYSTIPPSKFTNMQTMHGTDWRNILRSTHLDTPDKDEGYMGKKCAGNLFVAGTSTSLDCGVLVTRNQPPTAPSFEVDLTSRGSTTINLDATDHDNDYLIFRLTELPKHGTLSPNTLNERIPNVDGNSVRLSYTPSDNPPIVDSFKYSVSDGRYGHTVEGKISLGGEDSTPAAIDDLAFTIDGTDIHFTWSHPKPGGSPIRFYESSWSIDTSLWQQHDRYNKAVTSFTFEGREGYERYFRVHAYNNAGSSLSSNIVHVRIPDTSPPEITIREPAKDSIFTVPEVRVEGRAYDPENSQIEDIRIDVDGAAVNPPVLNPLSSSFILFESKISSLQNGNRTITVSAANIDGYRGSDMVDITVDTPAPRTLGSFFEDFENGLSGWHLIADDDAFWEAKNPSLSVPDSSSENMVAGARNCDSVCTMVMIDQVDLTGMDEPSLSFYRYVDDNADIPDGEGIIAYTSADGGDTWKVLERFTADESKDDEAWHLEEYDLGSYSHSTEFTLRFEAVSSSRNEETDLDNIRIFDAAHPIITAPQGITTEATGPTTIVDLGSLVLDSSAEPPLVSNDAPEAFPVGTTYVTWTAAYSSGSTLSAQQTVTITDTTMPTFVKIPESRTYVAESAEGSIVRFELPDAIDIVDHDVDVASVPPSGSLFPVGSTDVVFTATDDSGNSITHTIAISVTHDTLSISEIPDIGMVQAADRTVPVTLAHPQGAPVTLSLVDSPEFASVSYDGDGNGIIILDPGASDIGMHEITVRAEAEGLSATTSFTVEIFSPESAYLEVMPPMNITAEATGQLTPVNLGNATVPGSINPNFAISNDAPAGFPLGTTIVTWTVRDFSDNISTAFQAVTILDTTSPAFLNPPSSGTYMSSSPEGAVVEFAEIYATDAVDPDVTVSGSHESGFLFPVGNTTVTFTATDKSGNVSSHTITITVLQLPSEVQNVKLEKTSDSITASWDSYAPGYEYRIKIFPEGKPGQRLALNTSDTTHTFTGLEPDTEYRFAINTKGTKSTRIQAYETTDPAGVTETAPGFRLQPVQQDIVMGHAQTRTVSAVFSGGEDVLFSVLKRPDFVATQNDNIRTVTMHIDPEESDVGAHKVLIGATAGSRSVLAFFAITVLADNPGPPYLTVPDIIAEATGTLTSVDIGTATPNLFVGLPKITNDAPDKFPLGNTTVIWTAVDGGSTASASQTVTVQDTTPPYFTHVPESMTTTRAYDYGTALLPFYPRAEDLVDPDITVLGGYRPSTSFPVGNTTVTYTATDYSGNTASHTITIQVREKPVLKFMNITDDFSTLGTGHDFYDKWALLIVPPYTIEIDPSFGNPAPSMKVSGDQKPSHRLDAAATVTRIASVPDDGKDLFFGLDVLHNVITEVHVERPSHLTISMPRDGLTHSFLTSDETHGTWKSFRLNLGNDWKDGETIQIRLQVNPHQLDHAQSIHLDNFYLGTDPSQLSGPPQRLSDVPSGFRFSSSSPLGNMTFNEIPTNQSGAADIALPNDVVQNFSPN